MPVRYKCPCCDGEILRDDERKSLGHSVPECEGFLTALRGSPRASRVTIDVVDENDQLVASYPKHIDALIDRSSLGTPGAKALRARAPQALVDRVVKRSEELIGKYVDSLTEKERDILRRRLPKGRP